MGTTFASINKQILEAGRKDASKFLYSYLDNEDLIIDLLKNTDGIKSDIYLNEIDYKLKDLVKFSSVFSDITAINTTTSDINSSHIAYFEPNHKYWRDRQLTIPANYLQKTGTDAKRFLPCYIYRDDTEVKKLFDEYASLVLSNKLIIRPLRGLYVNFPEFKRGTLYYVDPNTANDHWYINEINHRDNIIIENGLSQDQVLKIFDITLPYFKGIQIDVLANILKDETDTLSSFRVQLKNLIRQSGDNFEHLDELKQDIIRPAIDTIERKFKTIVSTHRFKIGVTVGTFSLTLAAAFASGDLLKILPGALPVAGTAIALSERDFKEKLSNLKDNPYYLIWRISKNK